MESAKQPARIRYARRILSVAIVLHLFAAIIGSNKQSFLQLKAAAFLQPYGNFLEISPGWDFFAPDPGPPFSLEWELMNDSGEPISRSKWPDPVHPAFPEDRQFRRVCAARFMTLNSDRAERMMAPYLCRQNPQAASVRLWKVVQTVPSTTDVVEGRAPAQLREERQALAHHFCSREAKEGSGG